MSNPCINRWGLNSVWHHYWYSDSRYSLNLQLDNTILTLLEIYLNYGSDFYTRMLWNSFWYKTSVKPKEIKQEKYYRWLSVYNDVSMSTNNYPFRLSSEERFMTRTSVLKFNSWYVVNMYWFQPDKKKTKRLRQAKLHTFTSIQTENYRSLSAITKTRCTLKQFQRLSGHPNRSYSF